MYGGIFNSLPLTCFSWGEAGGERGAWFVSIFTQNDEHGRLEIRNEKVTRHCSPSQYKMKEKAREKKNKESMHGRARARRALVGKTGATSSARKRAGVSQRNEALSGRRAWLWDASTLASYVCECMITQAAQARPIAARGSPVDGQSASPGQPATAWSQACCSRAPGLTRAVIVTSARVANTVDTSWRHGAPRERHTSSPPSRLILMLCTSISLCRVREPHLFLSPFAYPWTASPRRFCESPRPSLQILSIVLCLSSFISSSLSLSLILYCERNNPRPKNRDLHIFFSHHCSSHLLYHYIILSDLFCKIIVLFLN